MGAEHAREAHAAKAEGAVVIAAPFAVEASFLAARDAAAIEAEWRDLAADAVEPNPFYAPALLLPALETFADEKVRLALVRDERGRMIALAPVAPARGYSRLPVAYVETWMHPHCFFAAPLIRRGRERDALAALFKLVEGEGAFFRLRHLDADGVLHAAALDAARAAGRLAAPSARYQRAMLKGGYESGAYLEAALRGKKRKELRRLRARLQGQGDFAFESLARAGDVDQWTDEFLALERAGWKGKAESALASSPGEAGFFRRALKRAHADGMLDFHRLRLGSRTIAAIVNFIENGAGYSFKIAYDEEFARYSPGVLLEIDMMRALEAREGLAFMDSCASRDHPMINSLWRERRTIEAINISGLRRRSKLLFRLLTALERIGEKARAKAADRVEENAVDDL